MLDYVYQYLAHHGAPIVGYDIPVPLWSCFGRAIAPPQQDLEVDKRSSILLYGSKR